jgi:hypothetical protein
VRSLLNLRKKRALKTDFEKLLRLRRAMAGAASFFQSEVRRRPEKENDGQAPAWSSMSMFYYTRAVNRTNLVTRQLSNEIQQKESGRPDVCIRAP